MKSPRTIVVKAFKDIELAYRRLWDDVYNRLSGGVTIGGADGSVDISATGDLTLSGTATVWNDIQFPIGVGKVPAANFPDYATFTTNTKQYKFDVDDYIDLQSAELSHSWKEGSVGDFHLHVALDAANATGSDRFAQFTAYVAYQNSSGLWVEASPISAELTIPTGSATLQGFYLDLGNLDFTGLSIETQILARVKRIAATGGTEYASHIFISQVGCHIEEDSLGSRTENNK